MKRCSERFLRGCLWATRHVDNDTRMELVLRRACQKLSLRTEEGCFTDPAINDKYIELCFGKDVWDRVLSEIDNAEEISDDYKQLFPELAFGSSLVNDIALVNQIFGTDTTTKRYINKGVSPKLYKHGTRSDSGLCQTRACLAPFKWVLTEYYEYNRDCGIKNIPIKQPYAWFCDEYKRYAIDDVMASPTRTTLNESGEPVPASEKDIPDDLPTVITRHATYMAGLYHIMCSLVSMRLGLDVENGSWHNVWYYGTVANTVSDTFLNQFSSINSFELLYMYIASKMSTLRKTTHVRLSCSLDKLDIKIFENQAITDFVKDGLKSGLFRLSSELLEHYIDKDNMLTTVMSAVGATETRQLFRQIFRTSCYTDYCCETLPGYRVLTLCGARKSDITFKYSHIPFNNALAFSPLTGDAAEKKFIKHKYLLANEAIDGDSLGECLNLIQPSEPVKLIYVGVADKPIIMLTEPAFKPIITANTRIFDYTSNAFIPLDDTAFVENTGSTTKDTLEMFDVVAGLSTGTVTGETLKRIMPLETEFAFAAIYDALEKMRSESGYKVIHMRNPWLTNHRDYENQHTPFPMYPPDGETKHFEKGSEGVALKLTSCRLKPIYALLVRNGSSYGLGALGGVQIVADAMTDKALMFRRESFLAALGVREDDAKVIADSLVDYSGQSSDHVRNIKNLFRIKEKEEYKHIVDLVVSAITNRELTLGPISLHNLKNNTLMDLHSMTEKLTWDNIGLWEIKRLNKLK